MPVDNGQGQSAYTPHKEKLLGKFLGMHTRICRGIFDKHKGKAWMPDPCYYFVDMYAGSGRNENVGCEGSPFVFLNVIRRAGLPQWRLACIEKKQRNYEGLIRRVNGNPRVKVLCGECEELAPALVDSFYYKPAYGVFYADPNGMPAWDTLGEIAAHPKAEKMDLLVHLSATTVKRARKAHGGDYLSALLGPMRRHKKHWLVREPNKTRGMQWTFLFGTAWAKYPEYKGKGFYWLDSPDGREIMAVLDNTQPELAAMRQRKLLPEQPFPTYNDYLRSEAFGKVRAQVMARAGGACEMCHDTPATEPHHLTYSNWRNGEVDVPDNLIAVCHECHCQLHGKEN